MKKTLKIVLVALIATSFTAFTPPVVKKMKVKESSITWIGRKVTGKHTGTINLKEGYLEMDNDRIVGGEFVIDMTSLQVTDLKAGKGKEKLEGHLSSDDFFGVANHPTATLVIAGSSKTGNTYAVEGSITIKGVTKPISFKMDMNGNNATAKVSIDRTKFGIKYGSGSFFDNLGNKAIKDLFDLAVDLQF
ncbi:YceI family protein [Aureisphaera galaxeae]|uniref:YceI family protein n=1 Tax=Aureisphaera galaxeae TaxID=1538023 RepID=UPI0023505375|nr:YceI family protein [Aureisphaera galaxeae]MDC8004427.1 YceI family protein [Aureisphaera galaxeae]